MNDAAQKPHPPRRGAATYDEMIEKAARGIHDAEWERYNADFHPSIERSWSGMRDDYVGIARAAFEAIGLTPDCVIVPKEPTPRMLHEMAGYTDFIYHEQVPDHAAQMEEMRSAWWAAIQAVEYDRRLAARPAGDGRTPPSNC
jgi:hypothetical protein